MTLPVLADSRQRSTACPSTNNVLGSQCCTSQALQTPLPRCQHTDCRLMIPKHCHALSCGNARQVPENGRGRRQSAPGEVYPLRVPKLIAHKAQPALSPERHSQRANHLVQRRAPRYDGVRLLQCRHPAVHLRAHQAPCCTLAQTLNGSMRRPTWSQELEISSFCLAVTGWQQAHVPRTLSGPRTQAGEALCLHMKGATPRVWSPTRDWSWLSTYPTVRSERRRLQSEDTSMLMDQFSSRCSFTCANFKPCLLSVHDLSCLP